jgi:hypothetical protein
MMAISSNDALLIFCISSSLLSPLPALLIPCFIRPLLCLPLFHVYKYTGNR